MAGWLITRIQTVRAALDRPWVKWPLLAYGALGLYDTVVSQLLPAELGRKAPNLYRLLEMTSGIMPWWAWLTLGGILVFVVTIEYAYQQKNELTPLVTLGPWAPTTRHFRRPTLTKDQTGQFALCSFTCARTFSRTSARTSGTR